MESAQSYQELRNNPDALIGILTERDKKIHNLEASYEALVNHLRNLNRKTFVKKNERDINDSQLSLFNFEESPSAVSTTKEPVGIEVPAHKRTLKRGRKALPDTLPRRREEHYPEEKQCKQCGSELKVIGEEITEELNYVPAHFEVIEHAKIKCACPNCKEAGVQSGKLPLSVQPLEGARPGAGLLAQIVVNKYEDHLPLARQEHIFERQGIKIARQRMCDWLAGVMDYLEILWRLLKAEVLRCKYLQGDETWIKVHEVEIPGQFVQGYFWAVNAPPEKLAFFEYYDTRAGEAALKVFEGYQGVLQTDAYAGYNDLLLCESVVRMACMAHIRRRFIDNRSLAPSECDRIIKQIAKLYKFESDWKNKTTQERLALRTKHAKPELEKLYQIFEETKAKLLPRHALQEHLNYALNQKQEMFRYLECGDHQLDNNAVERQIRPIALGRKNYLFAGSHEGAKRAAVFYSLLATCKLNNINPLAWLTHVLKTMPALDRANYTELLPNKCSIPAINPK